MEQCGVENKYIRDITDNDPNIYVILDYWGELT